MRLRPWPPPVGARRSVAASVCEVGTRAAGGDDEGVMGMMVCI